MWKKKAGGEKNHKSHLDLERERSLLLERLQKERETEGQKWREREETMKRETERMKERMASVERCKELEGFGEKENLKARQRVEELKRQIKEIKDRLAKRDEERKYESETALQDKLREMERVQAKEREEEQLEARTMDEANFRDGRAVENEMEMHLETAKKIERQRRKETQEKLADG